eukprot:CAMPEP_0202458558 /NCGR_PEP_ID=MMETSP1360-20130828/26450_1 /ASSEMBLY_ACC=CAM_ASM_000848 /TAXON_ID=515479 /ORGANISM="Licmophora paradoxa, Strain CCMP2313" /LENGTH=159 /DNA_ID=CAMNT_0049079163 /DNA_START=57 /DNA_END=537 /DNA_ORIENTATION=+
MQRYEGTLNRSTVALDRPTVNRSTWMIPGITHKARCLSDINGDRSTTSSTSSGSGMGLSMGSLGGFGCSEDRSSLKNGSWRRTSRCSLVSSSSYSSSPSTATATTRRSSSSSTSTSSSSYRSWDSSTEADEEGTIPHIQDEGIPFQYHQKKETLIFKVW